MPNRSDVTFYFVVHDSFSLPISRLPANPIRTTQRVQREIDNVLGITLACTTFTACVYVAQYIAKTGEEFLLSTLIRIETDFF